MNYSITISGETLPILIRRHASARRIVIRYQPLAHALSLTLPRYVSIRQGLHFIEEKRRWIALRLKEKPPFVPFADGQAIPVLGRDYVLAHVGGRGVVHIDGDRIVVPGEASFMQRRVREWLKTQLRQEIDRLAGAKAQRIGVKLKKIVLRDTSSRWGSCSHDGNLSFSWRLVFAPAAVLEYMVSHEVAHLKEHNHSDAFWAVVESVYKDYTQAQRWLSAHGQTLYAYG